MNPVESIRSPGGQARCAFLPVTGTCPSTLYQELKVSERTAGTYCRPMGPPSFLRRSLVKPRLCLPKTPSSDFPTQCNALSHSDCWLAALSFIFLNVADFKGVRAG